LAPSLRSILDEIERLAGSYAYQRLNKLIADAIGVKAEYVNTKSLSAANQTSPRTGEFATLRRRYEQRKGAPSDWIFVGLLTGPASEYQGILASLSAMLDGVVSGAIIFGAKPDWHPLRVLQASGRSDLGNRLLQLTGLDANKCTILNTPHRSEPPSKPRSASVEQSSETSYTAEEAAKDLFLTKDEVIGLIDLVRSKKNVIFQGPPGVGKSFVARRVVSALLGTEEPANLLPLQFHQSYTYEDFIQGWRPTKGGFSLLPGILKRFITDQVEKGSSASEFVVLIDEINRANVSKVFGELMTLIETDKRSEKYAMPLAYSADTTTRFHVPENVYFLGTMNTADRSLAMVDFALRRRFAFVDFKPAFDNPAFQEFLKASGADDGLVAKIVERMNQLNSEIRSETRNLGPGYEIGHSFFTQSKENETLDEAWYRTIVDTEIAPLIREYWFDDADAAEQRINALRQ
jgi:MoxR-like ATPase